MEPDISRVHIIGTSHIAAESVKEITRYLNEHDVDVVCVELDKDRLYALKNKVLQQRIRITNFGMIKQVGITGFLFALIAHFMQKRIGKKIDMDAGSDMLAAVNCAQMQGLSVALVDQNVNTTLKNLSKKVSFFEKMRIVKDLFMGLLGFKSAMMGVNIKDMDLTKVPPEKMITEILLKTKDRYPGLYKVLVDDRNVYMVNKIQAISKNHSNWNILAVVGAGHKKGMIELLEKKSGLKYNNNKPKNKKKDEGYSTIKESDFSYKYSYTTN